MSEIIYRYPLLEISSAASGCVHWLDVSEIGIFNRHLVACGQRQLAEPAWKQIYSEGTVYCGKFVDGAMVARACVEKYSDEYWEVADVRTVREYRNFGYAADVCLYVLQYILSHNKIATIRTEEDNYAMQTVIARIGFVNFSVYHNHGNAFVGLLKRYFGK